MATKVYGRKRKSSGGPGKRLGKRKVWRETPTGSSGRAGALRLSSLVALSS